MLAQSCVCFLKPASAPDAQHEDSTSLIDPCKALRVEPVLENVCMTLAYTVTQFQGVISLHIGHFCGEQPF